VCLRMDQGDDIAPLLLYFSKLHPAEGQQRRKALRDALVAAELSALVSIDFGQKITVDSLDQAIRAGAPPDSVAESAGP
jgi:hypothetical protein